VKSNTTLGASVGQVSDRLKPRRSGLLIASVVLVAGGGIAAYFAFGPTPGASPSSGRRPVAGDVAPTPAIPARKPVARVRVAVSATPPLARFALDGNEVATGHVDEELSDGAEHTLTVTAPGYRAARFVFRDQPPPETVQLEPIAAPAAESPAPSTPPSAETRPKAERRERDGGHRKNPPAHKNDASSRVRIGVDPNGTPIID
jgi:hypothetical protein